MGPLATLDHSMDDGKNLRLDAYLKPNHDFNETSGKLRLAVRFLECPQYHEIPSREDLSRDEVSSMWYSESEYNYMKTVNVATLRLMMSASGQDMNESIYCTRGLVRLFNCELQRLPFIHPTLTHVLHYCYLLSGS